LVGAALTGDLRVDAAGRATVTAMTFDDPRIAYSLALRQEAERVLGMRLDKVRKFGSSEATLVPSKSTQVDLAELRRGSGRRRSDQGEPAAA
jgi:hypothetical protein